MLKHPDQLLGVEAWVDGVYHGAHAGDAIIQFEMPVRIPGDGGNAFA